MNAPFGNYQDNTGQDGTTPDSSASLNYDDEPPILEGKKPKHMNKILCFTTLVQRKDHINNPCLSFGRTRNITRGNQEKVFGNFDTAWI